MWSMVLIGELVFMYMSFVNDSITPGRWDIAKLCSNLLVVCISGTNYLGTVVLLFLLL